MRPEPGGKISFLAVRLEVGQTTNDGQRFLIRVRNRSIGTFKDVRITLDDTWSSPLGDLVVWGAEGPRGSSKLKPKELVELEFAGPGGNRGRGRDAAGAAMPAGGAPRRITIASDLGSSTWRHH